LDEKFSKDRNFEKNLEMKYWIRQKFNGKHYQ
jgi:hypothetical protein